MKTTVGSDRRHEVGKIVSVARVTPLGPIAGTGAKGKIVGETTFEAFLAEHTVINGGPPPPAILQWLKGRFYYEVEVD